MTVVAQKAHVSKPLLVMTIGDQVVRRRRAEPLDSRRRKVPWYGIHIVRTKGYLKVPRESY